MLVTVSVTFKAFLSSYVFCHLQICDTCRESFEQFWDEEKEAWHLRDAIQVDGKVCRKEKTFADLLFTDKSHCVGFFTVN